jgi:hypothetical protein
MIIFDTNIITMSRKPISKKVRFEVFKRDSFTCQYCGKKSPDVVLNVDHIHPVKKGGGNDILNLITSCFDCNSGKKAIPLSDDTAIKKQQKQLEELQDRREQLEMLMKWREGLMDLVDMQVDKYVTYIENYMPNYVVKDHYKLEIKKWIKKYNPEIIFESIDESAERYLRFGNDGATVESAEMYLSKIKGIIFYKSLSPLDQKKNWIKAIAAKKYRCQGWEFDNVLERYIQMVKSYGRDDEFIMESLQNSVRRLLNMSSTRDDFFDGLETWIEMLQP